MKHWVWVALAALGLMGMAAFGADYPTGSNPAEPARPGQFVFNQLFQSLIPRHLWLPLDPPLLKLILPKPPQVGKSS